MFFQTSTELCIILEKNGYELSKRFYCTATIKRDPKPAGYWNLIVNQRKLFDEVAKVIGIKSMKDWYDVKKEDILELPAGKKFGKSPALVLQLHNTSMLQLITTIYPEYEWKFWKFGKTSSEYWIELENQYKFLQALADSLNFTKLPEDFYKLKVHNVIEFGGRGLLHYYDNSLHKMLENLYQNFEWKPWRFEYEPVPSGFWSDKVTHRMFFNDLAMRLNANPSSPTLEWLMSLTPDHITSNGGAGLLAYYGNSIRRAITSIFPEFNFPWKVNSLSEVVEPSRRNFSKSQRHLHTMTKDLFPEIEDVHFSHKIDLNSSERAQYKVQSLEIDVYLPSINLGFEYQGPHHYKELIMFEGKAKQDELKVQVCKKRGITLISIPYWWDGSQQSLVATIKDARPELLPNRKVEVPPISLTNPK